MRRVVRACVHAARLGKLGAQVAGRRFSFGHHGLLAPPLCGRSCIVMLPKGQFRAQRPQPTHQSSITVSSELRRRMEPTGQPTMQSGSRQWRQDVGMRYLSKRSPSRTSRVTPSCASAAGLHAVVAARAFLQIDHQQAVGFHQPLGQEGIERDRRHRRGVALVVGHALGRRLLQVVSDVREALHHRFKVFGVDAHHFHVIERRYRKRYAPRPIRPISPKYPPLP